MEHENAQRPFCAKLRTEAGRLLDSERFSSGQMEKMREISPLFPLPVRSKSFNESTEHSKAIEGAG